MEQAEAERLAEGAAPEFKVPPDYAVASTDRRFIEVPSPGAGDGLRDALAWVVRFAKPGWWIDLSVEDATGRIVRVERSRGAP